MHPKSTNLCPLCLNPASGAGEIDQYTKLFGASFPFVKNTEGCRTIWNVHSKLPLAHRVVWHALAIQSPLNISFYKRFSKKSGKEDSCQQGPAVGLPSLAPAKEKHHPSSHLGKLRLREGNSLAQGQHSRIMRSNTLQSNLIFTVSITCDGVLNQRTNQSPSPFVAFL